MDAWSLHDSSIKWKTWDDMLRLLSGHLVSVNVFILWKNVVKATTFKKSQNVIGWLYF